MLRSPLSPPLRNVLQPALNARASGDGSSLSLNFTASEAVDSRITFSGGAGGTRVNSAGVIVAASAPRFDYSATSIGTALGLLIEEQRTNLLLNSLLDGTNLATQSVTVTAQAYTLSFYGTGTVTLSGASTAGPLTGTGSTAKSTLTFTPTAGSLTLTVTGTVKWANLEAGSVATSFIPTAGAAVTRTADSVSMTGTNFSSWFNASAGTFYASADTISATSAAISNLAVLSADDGTTNERLQVRRLNSAQQASFIAVDNGSVVFNESAAAWDGSAKNLALAYAASDFQSAIGGVLGVAGTTGTLPTPTQLQIGNGAGIGALNGHIRRVKFYPRRLANAQLQTITA